MKIGAVVVLYNSVENAIFNILTYVDKVDELVIIDNSAHRLKNERLRVFDCYRANVTYYKTTENIGLCAGMNLGIKIASNTGVEWCLLMDADSYPENDILKIYKNVICSNNMSQVAMLGPQYDYDRRKIKKREGVYPISFLMTSGAFVNIKIFIKLNGFDERLFIDGLDYEFCLRLKKAGYQILECREAVLKHHPAITKEISLLGKKIKYGYDVPIRYYYQSRSYCYMILHYHSIHAIINWTIKFGKILLLFDKKIIFMRAYMQGIKDCRNNKWGKADYTFTTNETRY